MRVLFDTIYVERKVMILQLNPFISHGTSCINLLCIVIVFVQQVGGVYKRILNANDVNICRQPLYYDMETLYVIRAHDNIYASNCEIKFLDWNDAIVGQPCVSLCVRVYNNSMKSCDFEMTYYDGLGDINAQSFDCHSFPPILWCSRKNEIKIAFTELRKYKGEGYDITLEVTSYCSQEDESTTDQSQIPVDNEDTESYDERNRKEEKRQRDTVIIAGSLVSTVSFIFVIFWVTYCCWKRQYLTEPRPNRGQTTAGSATSSSTPKSDGSGHKPCQYSAFAAAGTNTQQFYPPVGRPYMQQKQSPLNSNLNYQAQPKAERYVQFPDSEIGMKDSFVQYKNKPQPSMRDPYIREDNFLTVDYSEGGHSYDADDDSPDKELTPPVPPRPNLSQYQAKQYFI